MAEWFKRRVAQPLLNLLKTGLSPLKLAQSVAFGVVIAVFPALGWTTLLCAGAAVSFRLNMVAIQTVNYLSYPLQILLILPFFRAGEWVFHAEPLKLTPSQLFELVKNTPWLAVQELWTVTWHAVLVWLVLAPFAILLLTWILTPIFERASRRSVQAGA